MIVKRTKTIDVDVAVCDGCGKEDESDLESTLIHGWINVPVSCPEGPRKTGDDPILCLVCWNKLRSDLLAKRPK